MLSANSIPSTGSPIGARWFRAALQVNPYEYYGNPAPSRAYPDEASYNDALLDECETQGISLIAITDHWRATSAVGLIEAAKLRGITALPGFEANTSEGIHLLVIFETGTNIEDITLAIGASGLTPGDPHAVATKSFAEIVTEMTNRGALVIPAHVNVANSGLLCRVMGKPLEALIKMKQINALGVTPSAANVGAQDQILKNKAPFKRRHALVRIHADDISAPAALATEGGSTWFKMCEPGLTGLKHAIRTPETRVSLVDPASSSRVLLREISWVGGFLNGQNLPLTEDLTALIGGRGTGKSTVIESLRYVLDIAPIGDAARKDHDSVIKNVVRTATTISLTVDVTSPEPARYTVERTVPDPALVKDSSGTVTSLHPRDIVGNLEIFGQHELAELAQDKTLMAQMVSRVAGKPVAAKERPGILQSLAENREGLRKVEQDDDNLEAELADIPRLTERAKKFSESNLGTKLEQQTILKSEEGIFSEVHERLRAVQDELTDTDLDVLAKQLRAPLQGIDSSPRVVHLKPAHNALELAARAVESAQEALTKAFEEARTATDTAKAAWGATVKPIKETNAKVFRQLIEDGYNPDEYIQTKAQLDRLTKRAEQREVHASRKRKLLGERASLLEQLETNDTAIAKELNDAIAQANSATTSAVVVKPVPDPDRSLLKAIVDKHFTTPRTQVVAATQKDDFSSRAFVDAARSGAKALEPYGITGAQLKNFLELGEPLFRELEEQSIGRAVDVQLNVAQKGNRADLRRLEDLSKGQRATALLLLLLGASSSPLVIDQPEDDLDNRFIYDGIVTRLRDLKGSRQIIVSTHNANVPVLGDADLVIALEGDGRNGWLAPGGIGSLDAHAVREYAEDLLEGGRDAFRARQHLYDF
ncbi:TrlF family AAA-like ATPase [Pseudarthrobacter sp. 1C304]|uniref:TrlF family AAA-like ATPase n=1 Tax=Pseudarthrobacter sp. 1C304 TaxID=3457438 RepID=UPI003FD0B2E6